MGYLNWVSSYASAIRSELWGANNESLSAVNTSAARKSTNLDVGLGRSQQMIACISHELRTPLTAISACVESLFGNEPNNETREVLRLIRSQCEMMRMLTNDILDHSQITTGNMQIIQSSCSPARLLSQICSAMGPLAKDKGLNLVCRVDGKLPQQFQCDERRLRQVLLNLVSNAIKFTDEGNISIISTLVEREEYGYLRITIRDTGIGIPKGMQEYIFEDYTRCAPDRPGTGLGLPIARRLCKLMGVELTVASEVGIGSAFTLEIPLGNCQSYQLVENDGLMSNASDSHRQSVQVHHFSLRVLAAEDMPPLQFVLERVVGKLVDHLDIVSDGRAAVEQVMRHEGSAEGYDLVLMDVQMPGIGGLDATRQLRREGFKKPIVALSAGVFEQQRTSCIDAGCSDFIPKPIDRAQLLSILQNAEDTRGQPAPN
jgi:CheY-like chemotaxis protein/anti-sigma regulatory factor (Ser/Thr protein kinase)